MVQSLKWEQLSILMVVHLMDNLHIPMNGIQILMDILVQGSLSVFQIYQLCLKMKQIFIFTSLVLLFFQFSACEQKDIWNKSAQPIDDIAPELISAMPLSNTEVEVTFSEEMDQETAEEPLNYSIPGLSITSAVRDITDYSLVVLTTSS